MAAYLHAIAADLDDTITMAVADTAPSGVDIDITVNEDAETIKIQWSTLADEPLTEEQAADVEQAIEAAATAAGLEFTGDSGGTGRYLVWGEVRSGCWSTWYIA